MPGRSLEGIVNVADVRERARRALPRMVFDFADGAAEDERSMHWNEAAYARLAFVPRAMVDVHDVRTAVDVLGERLAFPVVLGPVGLPGLFHPRAEFATARAAHAMGTVATIGTIASYAVERVTAAVPGSHWFQLYAWRDRTIAGALIDKARAAGCRVLLVTVDTPVVGQRERDIRNGMQLPPRPTPANAFDLLRHPRWIAGQLAGPGVALPNIRGLGAKPAAGGVGPSGYLQPLFNPELTWDDLAWIKERFGGPVGVKGILSAADALRARDAGADTIVVSNHGGRQLNDAIAPLDVLPEIAAALAGSGMPILIDGGIRRGSDVVKALCLGATACLIARPWLYGLAAGGQAGVIRVLAILRAEIERTLALLGEPDVAKLRSDLIRPAGGG